MKFRLVPVVAILALAGCAKFHKDSAFVLNAGESQNIKVSAPVSEQKLKIVLASDQPVNIWVVIEKDVPGGADDFDPTAMKSGVIASSKKAKEATLDVTIPAKEAYRVFVNGVERKASVTVTIDGK